MTDSGDGGEGGGDELPCATEGKGGERWGINFCGTSFVLYFTLFVCFIISLYVFIFVLLVIFYVLVLHFTHLTHVISL